MGIETSETRQQDQMLFKQTAEQQDLLLMMENRPVAQKEKEQQISKTLENLKASMKSLTSKQITEAESQWLSLRQSKRLAQIEPDSQTSTGSHIEDARLQINKNGRVKYKNKK